ncbi:MAG: PEGA domain-containing protein [Sandaracinaceae bacterium]|nr:PEGA domain-containing protein [Sandaracinaceae bacterium]
MTFFGRFLSALGLALALALVVAPLVSAQEDREAARAEFDQGRRAFEAGAFREALDHFQEAYRLAPHPNVRVNIANCYDQLDRPIEALFHFEHFLTEADHPPAAQRREVESAITRLRQRVGSISLQITPDGAVITIDGSETRRAPVSEPVRVVAGSHTVEIQLEGYRAERQTVVVEGGGTARVALRLQRGDAVVASTGTGTSATTTSGSASGTTTSGSTTSGSTSGTTTSSGTETASTGGGTSETATTSTGTGDSSEGSGASSLASGTGSSSEGEPAGGTGGGLRITTPVIITGAVTGAALLGTIIMGSLALSANGSFEDAVRRANDPSLTAAQQEQARVDGQGAANDARGFAVATDVFLITTIVGAGVTTALFIIAQGESDQDDTVALVPVISPTTTGLVASGRF